jgi:hypothetical protein
MREELAPVTQEAKILRGLGSQNIRDLITCTILE